MIALLLEVMVVAQHIGDSLRIHRVHRRAIGQTVFLVEPSGKPIERPQEGVPRLRDDLDVGVAENVSDGLRGLRTEPRPVSAERAQELAKHFIGGYQDARLDGSTRVLRCRRVSIAGLDDRDPVQRIGKDLTHYFGVP